MSAEGIATLAAVAALLIEKIMTRCDLYPAGVKTLHCQASKCFQFDVERSSGTPTPAKELSGAHQQPTLPTTSNELVEIARRLSVSIPEEPALPPSVQKMG